MRVEKMQNETGRSMVEMLGILAIVGVISIGAVAGYNYGMNRYRTNELLDGGTKRAYTVATQLSFETPVIDLSEFKEFDDAPGGTFQQTVKEWTEGEFGIQVKGVQKDVCENLIRMIGDNTPLRAITTTEEDNETEIALGECAEGDNDIYLVYNIDMLSKAATDGQSNSGNSSTGGESTSSSVMSVTHGYAPYCSTNSDSCTSVTDADGNEVMQVTKSTGGYDYEEAAYVVCGGKDKMATAEQFGCSWVTGSCSVNVTGWLSCVNGDDYSDCEYPWYVYNGSFVQGKNGEDYTVKAVLCK